MRVNNNENKSNIEFLKKKNIEYSMVLYPI